MINEHDYVVVLRDLPDVNLRAGDVGLVIHVHRDAQGAHTVGYLLELFSVDGHSLDEVSVPADAVRSAQPTDRLHARVAAE